MCIYSSLIGYQPFSDDPEKQSRYESYLQGARSRHGNTVDSNINVHG